MSSPTITLDPVTVKQMVDHAVEQNITTAIQALSHDPAWLEKIERQISQTMVDNIIAHLSRTDITPIIKQHVEENMGVFRKDILEKFRSDYLGWLFSGLQEDWMREYHEQYKNFIEL